MAISVLIVLSVTVLAKPRAVLRRAVRLVTGKVMENYLRGNFRPRECDPRQTFVRFTVCGPSGHKKVVTTVLRDYFAVLYINFLKLVVPVKDCGVSFKHGPT